MKGIGVSEFKLKRSKFLAVVYVVFLIISSFDQNVFFAGFIILPLLFSNIFEVNQASFYKFPHF